MTQTLFIPSVIRIELVDNLGRPLRQQNVLLGIETFANHKNDIDIFPFLSDIHGHFTITSGQIKQHADRYISYGIMDYAPLESAKPDVQIYYWGNRSLDRCINYWSTQLNNKTKLKLAARDKVLKDDIGKEFEKIREREMQLLKIFSTCYNRSIIQDENIILVRDSWSKPVNEKFHKVILPF